MACAGKYDIGRSQRDDLASRIVFTRIRDANATFGLLEFINFLQNPNVKLTDDKGCTILHALILSNRWWLLEALVLSGRFGELELARFPESAGDDDRFKGLTAEEIAEKLGKSDNTRYLSVRDMICECARWERSLSEAMRAARRGDLKRLKELMQQLHDVFDELDLRKWDVLFWALTGGHLDVIDFLLNYIGVDVNGRVQNVFRMLLFANQTTVDHVMSRLVETNPAHLIKKYINMPDMYTNHDQWGIVYGRVTVMGDVAWNWKVYVLDRNRSKQWFEQKITVDNVGNTATVILEGNDIKEVSNKNMEEIFVLKNDQFMPSRKDRAPLHHAVRVGNHILVKVLLDHGAEVNQRDACSMTPLHTAAVTGDKKMVQFLLSKGADPQFLDATMSTARMVAEDNEHQFQLLLANETMMLLKRLSKTELYNRALR